MRKLAGRVGSALLAVCLGAIVLPASAADTSVDVRANIKGTCEIGQVTMIDFGDLTQGTTATDRTQTGSVTYWCTKGLVYTVNIGNGSNYSGATRRMKGVATTNSTEFLPYELTGDKAASGNTGKGPATTQDTLTLTASVRGVDYNALSVGQLHDTVVVTIAP